MTAYDQIAYVNRPYAQTHPDHLGVLARLAGLEAAPAERCRVLELGASEGANIIAMAIELPEAEFTGIDLARIPIERGRQVVEDLGLRNVRLLQKDLLDLDESFGKFDYIIAHGLYAWTPPAVRDALLRVARTNLNPQGVAFVSYNTYPGGHLRKLLREMMLFHIAGIEDPNERIAQARAVLQLAAKSIPDPNLFDRAMAAEADEVVKLSDSAIFHDYLTEFYEPAYFHEFVAHAARHGLQYLGEARVEAGSHSRLSSEAMATSRMAAAGNHIAEEQYLDLFRLRRFRRTLVCHAEARLAPAWDSSRAVGLFASASANETGEGVFEDPRGGRLTTNHPAAIEWMRQLIAEWPRAVCVEEEQQGLALQLFRGGMIELRTTPGLAQHAGVRPEASPLARYQCARGETIISTLRHGAIEVTGEPARKLLGLLDGTRDRTELAAEMGCTRAELDLELTAVGRHALLLA